MANTVDDCGKIWELCYNPSEVRNIKDMHIQARIGQFQDNSDEIDVNKCLIVKEYQESGRADNMKQTIRHSIHQNSELLTVNIFESGPMQCQPHKIFWAGRHSFQVVN